MPTLQSPLLRAQTKVLLDHVGHGQDQRALRRAFLFDRRSGLILELQTAFVDLEFGVESLNTQIAVLADLALLHEWTCAQAHRPDWLPPEQRASQGEVALTDAEVRDLARWCQLKAEVLARRSQSSSSNIAQLPSGDIVSAELRNRRLRHVSRYLQWLTTSLAANTDTSSSAIAACEVRRERLSRSFARQLNGTAKYTPPRSLEPNQARALREVIRDAAQFPPTAHGTRDRLILELLQQGVRAGELLKIQVDDIDDALEVYLGRQIGNVSIERRPNDADDSRVHEPAVKTRPGDLPVPRRLACELIDYVATWRREAIDARGDAPETPYLFVCHSGPLIGRPISQRNLNRIVAKLKGRAGLPSSLTPHVLRHTHFTELYDMAREKGRSDEQIRDLLILRGRWAPSSDMPAHYTARSLMREAADFAEERERLLELKEH